LKSAGEGTNQRQYLAMPYALHPSAGTLPPDDTVIWRFMSLAKFLSLLTKSSIYFSQAYKLRDGDPYEGTLSRPNVDFYQTVMANETFARQVMQTAPNEPLPFNYHEVFSPNERKRLGDIHASTTYINCWNISKHESAFLWSMYATPSDGIGIRSTIGRLQKSIEKDKRDIYIGPVIYIDYNSEVIPQDNMLSVFPEKKELRSRA
jgi:hypothetical protein